MATVLNRTGTIFKKCDRKSHKPNSNKRCADGACQHTCDNPEKCPHAWTVRYSVNGKQREASFHDEIRNGRTVYGSGRKLAQDFQLKLTLDKRAGEKTFPDYGKTSRVNFGDAAEAHISHMAVGEHTKETYLSTFRNHVEPVFGDRTLAQVANDRDGVKQHLSVTLKGFSDSVRRQARLVIVGTCDEAVKAKKIAGHLLGDIDLVMVGSTNTRGDFIFPSHAQVTFVANGGFNPGSGLVLAGAGVCVWLMRGCGLRVEEALAVCKEDFKDNGSYLRVMWQASRDGREREPLKHRKQGEYRDVPVPSWLWEIVKDMPDGPLMPGTDGRMFMNYHTILKRFKTAARVMELPETFTPHSLRHAFASALLARLVPITDVGKWLGHRNINVTYATYGHLVPSAASRAKAALDDEFSEWSKS